jgi:phenylpyruvate tautomerase PptA (4-oxalocrotonate tautomerase family)
MPYLKLSTNVEIHSEKTQALLANLSQLMANKTAKPEEYVMIEIADKQCMLFAGNSQPLAYIECKNIGLTIDQTQTLAEVICQLLLEQLAISPNRIYIEFTNIRAEYWAWDGSTFG